MLGAVVRYMLEEAVEHSPPVGRLFHRRPVHTVGLTELRLDVLNSGIQRGEVANHIPPREVDEMSEATVWVIESGDYEQRMMFGVAVVASLAVVLASDRTSDARDALRISIVRGDHVGMLKEGDNA